MRAFVKNLLNSFGMDIGRYPTPIMKGFSQMLKTNKFDLILDVGANNGSYAKELRKLGFKERVVSFEPLTEPYEELRAYANKSKFNHVALNCALGEFDGKAIINISENSVSSSLLEATAELYRAAPETKVFKAQEITVMQLDSIFSKYCNPEKDKIFLKLDVQGYEKNVLLGASNSIKHIDGIQLEVALVELYTNELLFKEMLPYVEDLGFELYLLIPGFHDQETGRLLEVDCIFLRK